MKFRFSKVIDAHTHPAGPGLGIDNSDGEFTHYKDDMPKVKYLAERGRPEEFAKKMDEHGVHMGIALCSVGFTDENPRIVEIVQQYPNRFPACFVGFKLPFPNRTDFDPETVANEIDTYLKMPEVKGVGEWPLMVGAGMETWPELWVKWRPIMDVIAEHKKAVLFHTGVDPYPHGQPRVRGNGKPGFASSRGMYFSNPVLIDDVATEYPDVPIIIGHCGVQGFYYFGSFADMALSVAARHDNVYLETSSAPLEVVERAVCDPAISPDRVIFGSDLVAPYGYYKFRGRDYVSYMKAPGDYIPDHLKYDLAVIDELPINNREKEKILGTNIADLLGLEL